MRIKSTSYFQFLAAGSNEITENRTSSQVPNSIINVQAEIGKVKCFSLFIVSYSLFCRYCTITRWLLLKIAR